jgi:hypothetical protein
MNIVDKITSEQSLSPKKLKILSLFFLLITVLLFWLPNYRTGIKFGFFMDLSKIPILNNIFDFTKPVSLIPQLIAGVIGIILITPLYKRGILHWGNASIYSLISYALNLALASTITVICLGNPTKSLLDVIWPIQDFKLLLLVIAIILSWCGLEAIAGLAYILLFVLAFLNATMVSHAMGFNGYLCVLFGTLGLILQNNKDPQSFFSELKDSYKKPIVSIKDSILETKKFTKKK